MSYINWTRTVWKSNARENVMYNTQTHTRTTEDGRREIQILVCFINLIRPIRRLIQPGRRITSQALAHSRARAGGPVCAASGGFENGLQREVSVKHTQKLNSLHTCTHTPGKIHTRHMHQHREALNPADRALKPCIISILWSSPPPTRSQSLSKQTAPSVSLRSI